MATYVCYSLENGLIEHTRQTTPELIVNATKPDNHEYLEIAEDQYAAVSNMNDWYVDLASLTFSLRPAFDIPETLELTLGDQRDYPVPNGTEVNIDGDISVVDDETLEISADVVGVYEIKLSLGIYKPLTIEVIVNENSA